MRLRRRRTVAAILTALIILVIAAVDSRQSPTQPTQTSPQPEYASTSLASEALNQLEVKGRAPKTGYSRAQFGDGWGQVNGCDVRNLILQRDMVDTAIDQDGCKVISGVLQDPYTAKTIQFKRGTRLSSLVQIDHIVALSDAWQKGAQQLSFEQREKLANDPLELLAVDGPTNEKKGDGDAATWLPPNKPYRCQYVARQIAVKQKYHLWITQAEKDAMKRVLNQCPTQKLPIESS